MTYTRVLKKGMKGDDVKYIQSCLISLDYSCGNSGADGSFGISTEKAVITFQKRNKLKLVDGKVGKETWNAIETKIDALKIKYTRVLKKGMSGNDVKHMKDCLFTLNYFNEKVKKISSKSFGNDTVEAVKKFQVNNKTNKGSQLKEDGMIGELTWDAIEREFKAGNKYVEKKSNLLDSYTHISKTKREAIEKDLVQISELRQKICLEILDYACDADCKKEVRALYQLGANLYNTDLTLNYADKAETEKLAKRNPDYFDGGRKEWMLEQIKKNPKLPVSDCSGMEVGFMRKHKLVSATFDTTANNLCGNSYSVGVKKSELMPGDWVGKSGHIGTYVGGGYVVEFYGGAYGCQLTKLTDRRGYNFISKKIVKGSAWTKYRRPKKY